LEGREQAYLAVAARSDWAPENGKIEIPQQSDLLIPLSHVPGWVNLGLALLSLELERNRSAA
jgi:hypothetical protein